ncbi:SDR family oxidoreductase [Chitinophaga oryzae]|uniref:SDR family oxidoreductase n=1 Tax=Chitinophaga oryzae TaxID=2725414 RepID=A0ABX6LAX5_9BACT|nr:SDR family oxidoreductase [Chitinophaga oryzae]QJB36979.1 SDR family oxidoreductase [Chitinophaga oryzae]
MKVFVTGASGFVGTAVVQELIKAGHQVLGLARSKASADKLEAAGAQAHLGDLEDLDSLRQGAAESDGVAHCGFVHDFTRFAEICAIDERAIETIASVLAGTDRPLIVTSGTALVRPGAVATEDMPSPFNPAWPRASERAAEAAAAAGVRAAILRLPPSVHGKEDKHGFIPILVNLAREKGFSAYIGEGQNRWNAGHRLDAALLYRLALEQAAPGARFHANTEEGVTVKSIAAAIGRQLNLPVKSIPAEQAAEHFGWFAQMAAIDCPSSSKWTQEHLNWRPSNPLLLNDIDNGIYTQ